MDNNEEESLFSAAVDDDEARMIFAMVASSDGYNVRNTGNHTNTNTNTSTNNSSRPWKQNKQKQSDDKLWSEADKEWQAASSQRKGAHGHGHHPDIKHRVSSDDDEDNDDDNDSLFEDLENHQVEEDQQQHDAVSVASSTTRQFLVQRREEDEHSSDDEVQKPSLPSPTSMQEFTGRKSPSPRLRYQRNKKPGFHHHSDSDTTEVTKNTVDMPLPGVTYKQQRKNKNNPVAHSTPPESAPVITEEEAFPPLSNWARFDEAFPESDEEEEEGSTSIEEGQVQMSSEISMIKKLAKSSLQESSYSSKKSNAYNDVDELKPTKDDSDEERELKRIVSDARNENISGNNDDDVDTNIPMIKTMSTVSYITANSEYTDANSFATDSSVGTENVKKSSSKQSPTKTLPSIDENKKEDSSLDWVLNSILGSACAPLKPNSGTTDESSGATASNNENETAKPGDSFESWMSYATDLLFPPSSNGTVSKDDGQHISGLVELAHCAARAAHEKEGLIYNEHPVDVTSEVVFSVIIVPLPLGILFQENEAGCWVARVFASGNAASAGADKVQVGDQLASVDGQSAVMKTTEEISALITGDDDMKKKQVELTFLRYIGPMRPWKNQYEDDNENEMKNAEDLGKLQSSFEDGEGQEVVASTKVKKGKIFQKRSAKSVGPVVVSYQAKKKFFSVRNPLKRIFGKKKRFQA